VGEAALKIRAGAPIAPPTLADDPVGAQREARPGASLPPLVVADIAARCVSDILECDPLLVLAKPRGSRQLAHARQLGNYLVHIIAGYRHGETPKAFNRNRSTASHHFEAIENLRDDDGWEMFMAMLEQRFLLMLQLADLHPKKAWQDALASLAGAVEDGRLEGDAHGMAEYLVQTFKAEA
jgi:hypothetical protein